LANEQAQRLPLDVHVFEHEGLHFAFDCRNYAILRLDALGAAVLERMGHESLEAITRQLSPPVSTASVRACYLRLLDLMQQGVFSSEPVNCVRRPFFHRLVLMLAGGCNMACSYCFEKDVPITRHSNLMSRETASKVLDWFFNYQEGDKAHLQLYGGEPLLNWPVLEFVLEKAERWSRDHQVTLTKYLITNGTLLNPERVRYLVSHGVSIQVSADGAAETHDRFRVLKTGEKTMHRIKPNIDELARQGAKFNLRAVLTRQNRSPISVIQGLRSLGADRVSFEVVATDQVCAKMTDEDWKEFNQEYRDFLQSSYTAWRDLPDEMQAMIIRICERKHLFYGCGAGVSEVTVDPEGYVYDCQRLYRRRYFSVAENTNPRELVQEATGVEDRPTCVRCWARYLCGGGCSHLFEISQGKNQPLPAFCVMKKNLAEAAIAKIYEIRRVTGIAQQC